MKAPMDKIIPLFDKILLFLLACRCCAEAERAMMHMNGIILVSKNIRCMWAKNKQNNYSINCAATQVVMTHFCFVILHTGDC